jgi:hypothetical protein
MRGVDRLDPRSYGSEIFWGRGFSSSGPRTSQNAVEGAPYSYVCGLDRHICVGGALIRFLGGFQGADSSGVASFNRRF